MKGGVNSIMNEHAEQDVAAVAMQRGYELLQSGASEQALAEFTRAEELYAAAADGQRQARASTNKALVLVQLRRFAEALAGFGEALKGFEQGDEFIRVAEQWGNIGSVYRDMGQPDAAVGNYREALSIYRGLGLRERAADQCTNLAYALFMKKEYGEALGWYREALALYTEAGSAEKRGLTAENVARLESALAGDSE